MKLPDVIFFNIDSYPSIHAFNCSQACVLNAHLKQDFSCLSLGSTTRLDAEPSAGAELHYFLQSLLLF